MTIPSPIKVLALLYTVFTGCQLMAQDCSAPVQLCGGAQSEAAATDDGSPVGVPASFCFTDAPNAVFFQFETLDTDQFPNLNFNDPTATLSLESINCDTNSTFGQGINLAVFSATDACDPATYFLDVLCEAQVTSVQNFALENLSPATTYYILITGLYGTPPDAPSSCEVSVSVSGPAVEYDLQPSWEPSTDPSRANEILFTGETANISANPDLSGYTWVGDNLDMNEGTEVNATHEVPGVYPYTVSIDINGCTFTDQVNMRVGPAVFPYNAFTPNGDGMNETWEIRNIQFWQNAQINVYSRWGQRVFQATNYNNDWDGDDLPAATYYYVIELNPIDFESAPYTGNVTIVR